MASTIAANTGDGRAGADPPARRRPGPRVAHGSRAAADLARCAWLTAYARGLAASPGWRDDAPLELLHAADHDAELLRSTLLRMPDEPARRLIADALERLEEATTGGDLEATRDLLLAQAELFENPADYAAGVRDALEAVRPLIDRDGCAEKVVDITDGAVSDQPGEVSSQ